MHPALSVVFATSLGWGPVEVQDLQPAQLLVEALATCFVSGSRIDTLSGPKDEVLSVWYPHSLESVLVYRPAPLPADPRVDIRYDWRLPIFRTKP